MMKIGVGCRFTMCVRLSVRWPTAGTCHWCHAQLRVVSGKRYSTNPSTTPTPTLHTWPGRMTSQWQSQLSGHPTPQHTHKTLEKKKGRGQLVHLTHDRTSRLASRSLQWQIWLHTYCSSEKSHPKPQPGSYWEHIPVTLQFLSNVHVPLPLRIRSSVTLSW